MAFFNDPTDPTHMTPDQRLVEVAAILAAGVLRLRNRQALADTVNPPEIPPDYPPSSLADGPEKRLHVSCG